MAAEVGFEVNLEQSCRCSFKSGQVRLNVTSQLMHVLRQRLALLHACQEARSLLAPRYDAFPYKKLLPARSGSAVVYEGVVEALDDLCLRPSTSSRRHGIIGTHESRSGGPRSKSLEMRTGKNIDLPELTWKHDHSYDPITGSWLHYDSRKPHVLMDVRQDTFSGRVEWRGDPWCANKRWVSLCALKRPESLLKTYVRINRGEPLKGAFAEKIRIHPSNVSKPTG